MDTEDKDIVRHCCKVMGEEIKNGSLNYDDQQRDYWIDEGYDSDQINLVGGPIIVFCPWCGTKLPKNLTSEFKSELIKVCGDNHIDKFEHISTEYICEKQRIPGGALMRYFVKTPEGNIEVKRSKILYAGEYPIEFQSGKWWRNRKL